MFASISQNPPIPHGKRVVGKPVEGNNTQYTLGLPEWQQKWETKYQEHYTEKDLHNNREILDKPYLKPNYSNFEYVHFPNKEPFLTSNRRDFKPIHMTEKDRAVLDEKTINFVGENGKKKTFKISELPELSRTGKGRKIVQGKFKISEIDIK